MNYKLILISSTLISGLMGTVLPVSVFAQIPTVSSLRQQIRQEKQEIRQDRCDLVETKISNLTTRLQNEESARQQHHQNMIDRLNKLIDALSAKSINTDKLKADVATLTDKKNAWQQQYTALLDKLAATKQYACGKSNGEFRQALLDAQAQRRTMRQTNVDFWNYVLNTVKPDLKTAREALKASTK